MTTEDGNRLIAEFFCERSKDKVYKWKVFNDMWADEGLKFNSSWGWIMPVVEKINNIYAADTPHIWQGELNAHIDEVIMLPLHTPIKTIWEAVVQFISWYIKVNPINKH